MCFFIFVTAEKPHMKLILVTPPMLGGYNLKTPFGKIPSATDPSQITSNSKLDIETVHFAAGHLPISQG